MANSPTMRRKRLGAELRRLRGDVSIEEAADALGCSTSRIGHIENGRNSPRKPDLKVLLDLYGASDDVREVLEELRKEGARRGWWATYRLPTWLQTYVGLESDATRIYAFEIELISALLQTKAYARRVHEKGTHVVAPDAVERLTDARIRRQAILDGPDAPELFVILSESALCRTAAEPNLGAEQLRHLADMARRPNITINILPHSTGLHPTMSGSFHILEFEPDVSPRVAYQEYAIGGALIDDQAVTDMLGELFETLDSETLKGAESLALIERLAGEAEGNDGLGERRVAEE